MNSTNSRKLRIGRFASTISALGVPPIMPMDVKSLIGS